LFFHIYFLNHPSLIEEVLVRRPNEFRKDRAVRNSRWLLGDGLLSAEGDHWKRQRRLIQPAFNHSRLESYASIMTSYAERMLESWEDGAAVDVHQQMMELTLRIVVRTLFGVESSDTERISRSLNTVMQASTGANLMLTPVFRRLPLPGM